MRSPIEAGPPHKDRRAGLVAFGILLVLVGCVCASLVPVVLAGPALVPAASATETANQSVTVSAAVVYAGLSAIFIWLGTGSILTRRWARALIVILAWLWLLTGILSVVIAAVLLPDVLAVAPLGLEPLPEAARAAVTVALLAALGLGFVALPAALVLFYQGRNVRATCEARDPVPRWTDRCPAPILGLSVSLVLAIVSIVPFIALYRPVVPFFGRLVTGAPAAALLAASMGILAYCAWATYRTRTSAWWMLTVSFLVATASSAMTFMRVEVVEMYRAMGYPEEQVAALRGVSFLSGPFVPWFLLATGLLMVGYMGWVRKYFAGKKV